MKIKLPFVGKAPAVYAGLIQAVIALVVVYVPNLPQEVILGLIAGATGLSFGAQKAENGKTLSALYTDPEDDDL
jgi:hypothetical protein